jgi:hypothetical protein
MISRDKRFERVKLVLDGFIYHIQIRKDLLHAKGEHFSGHNCKRVGKYEQVRVSVNSNKEQTKTETYFALKFVL